MAVRAVSEELARNGHDVTVATGFSPQRNTSVLNGVTIEQFQVSGNAVRGYKGDIETYQNFLRDRRFDLVLNYAAQTWVSDLAFPLLDSIAGRKVFAPCGYSRLRSPAYKKYYEQLPSILGQYDAIVYFLANYQDKHFGDKNGLTHYQIIPNGASKREFTDTQKGSFRTKYNIQTRYLLLNVSNHLLEKGHDFVIDAFRQVDRDDCTLAIIGEPRGRFRGAFQCYPTCKWVSMTSVQKIKVLRKIPREDVVNALRDADLFLFGSKLECSPLVIYESMAAETIWLSTPCGNVPELPGGMIVASPEEMAQKINDLLDDEQRRCQQANEGHKAWLQCYTWEQIAGQYEALYQRLCSS